MRDEEEGLSGPLVGPSQTQGLLSRPASSVGHSSVGAAGAGPQSREDFLQRKERERDCFDYFCRFLNATTAIVALLCLVANGMAIALYSPAKDLPDVLEQALRVYAMLGALLIALIETEWERLLVLFRFTEYWVGRALVQIFIALLTFKMATAEGRSCNPEDPDRSCDFNKSLELYRFASALALLGCGSFYFLGGILCFGLVRRARLRKERERSQAEADLLELEKKREALQGLLARRD